MGKIASFFSEQKITIPLQQKQQMLALDQEFEACKSKVTVLQAENQKLRAEVNPLKQEIERLKQQTQHSAPNTNPDGYVCDHCGSPNLKRTGSRPDPTFHVLGIKQSVFSCITCGKESAFTPESRR